jgi:hypothetical protein
MSCRRYTAEKLQQQSERAFLGLRPNVRSILGVPKIIAFVAMYYTKHLRLRRDGPASSFITSRHRIYGGFDHSELRDRLAL